MLFKLRCKIRHALRISSGLRNAPQLILPSVHNAILPSGSSKRLNALVDVSDPDLNLPNVIHLLQTAEGLRAEGRPDWMQLVGLIHDLGKAMYLFGSDEDGTSQAEQWGLVGDVFAVGCKFPDSCVYPEFNALNPDSLVDLYNTDLGVYAPGCGLDNLELAWGHDEYLYQTIVRFIES